MTSDLIEGILEYERSTEPQAAGTVNEPVLRRIAQLAPKPLRHSVETGCGKTTILLSNLADQHLCFGFDDSIWLRAAGDQRRGSVDFVTQCPLWRSDKTELVIGPSQRTSRDYAFTHPIDLALIDGAHAYPFPELDYYFLYPHLRSGSVLIVDDINIATIGRMAEFLSEDEMFERILVEHTTAFFRRTDAPTFDPEGDSWWTQRFNTTRLEAPRSAYRKARRKLRIAAGKVAPSPCLAVAPGSKVKRDRPPSCSPRTRREGLQPTLPRSAQALVRSSGDRQPSCSARMI